MRAAPLARMQVACRARQHASWLPEPLRRPHLARRHVGSCMQLLHAADQLFLGGPVRPSSPRERLRDTPGRCADLRGPHGSPCGANTCVRMGAIAHGNRFRLCGAVDLGSRALANDVRCPPHASPHEFTDAYVQRRKPQAWTAVSGTPYRTHQVWLAYQK